MSNNIFQDIIDKKIPADIVYEDELAIAFKDISPQDAVFLINKDAFILDVRESSELNQGAIKNSKHITFSTVESSIDSIKKYSDKPTIVYCKSGIRSSTVSNILTKNDFQEVYSMKGGFEAWVQDNLPVVKN